jgi:hypothetical protein
MKRGKRIPDGFLLAIVEWVLHILWLAPLWLSVR